jgi:hypothetical protein
VSEEDPIRSSFEADLERAQAVKRAHQEELLSKSNVVGVGVGLCMRGGTPTGQVGLVVFVRRKLPASQLDENDRIPNEIDAVPVDVQEVGEFRALRHPH